MTDTAHVTLHTASTCSRKYSYMIPDDVKIKKGDVVVVNAAGNIAIGHVQSTSAGRDAAATKFIVQKVDMTAYQEAVAKEQRKKTLEAKLKAIEKTMEVQRKYDYLKMFSPEAAEILEELEKIK